MKTSLYFSRPGVACAAGCDTETLWQSCVSGSQAGIKIVKAVSGKEFYAGKIEDSLLKSVPSAKYDMRIIRILNLAVQQIKPVVENAKLKSGAARIGVFLGCCDNGSEFTVAGHKTYFETGAFPEGYELEVQSADYPATFVKEALGLEGPAFVFATACSSGASAVCKAREALEAEIIDAAVVGGVDVASDTVLLGFDSLEAVSDEKTNPFSKNRKGITLGEGAALFVLSKDKELVSDSGVSVILCGTGESADASHMTAPLEDGSGARRAIEAALSDAGFSAEEIDYINLHGTGTHLNDAMESRAVDAVFGGTKNRVWASSTKPLMGHTLGASGALELAVCYEALVHSAEKKLPVQVWDGVRDDEIPALNFVSGDTVLENEIKTAMSNSFGFGGCNISLIIKKV